MSTLLPYPFVQFPLQLNVAELLEEIRLLGPEHWKGHRFSTLRSIPLIDRGVAGATMRPALLRLPKLRSFLCQWEAPLGESRISFLGPGAKVQEHVDTDYYWKHRLRVHIVLQSNPQALFGCDGRTLQLPVGECWVSNNWAPHWIANEGQEDRIHIVIDTIGSEKIWHWIERGWKFQEGDMPHRTATLPLIPLHPTDRLPLLEQDCDLKRRHPAEVSEICTDLLMELPPSSQTECRPYFQRLLQNWRTAYQCNVQDRQHYENIFYSCLKTFPECTLPNGLDLKALLYQQLIAGIP